MSRLQAIQLGTSDASATGADDRREDFVERRTRPTPRFSRYTLWGGRRRDLRREGEGDSSFVDQYSVRVWVLVGWVALMNSADSFFTLLHLQDGGIEVNPFAAWMLTAGRTGFVVIKSVLITLPLIVLCLHKNFPLARIGLLIAAGTYTLLCGYHIWLL